MNDLKQISDSIKEKVDNYAIVLVGIENNKPSVVVSLSDYVVQNGSNAGAIIKNLASVINGKGGGKEKFAQAGGTNLENIEKLFDMVDKIFENNQ